MFEWMVSAIFQDEALMQTTVSGLAVLYLSPLTLVFHVCKEQRLKAKADIAYESALQED
jgi:hypothetical protein